MPQIKIYISKIDIARSTLDAIELKARFTCLFFIRFPTHFQGDHSGCTKQEYFRSCLKYATKSSTFDLSCDILLFS